jgi:hypothetical protein
MILAEPDFYMLTLPGYRIAVTRGILLLATMGTYLPVTAHYGCEQSSITFQAPQIAAAQAQTNRDIFDTQDSVTICCILLTTARTGANNTTPLPLWSSLFLFYRLTQHILKLRWEQLPHHVRILSFSLRHGQSSKSIAAVKKWRATNNMLLSFSSCMMR